MWEVDSRVVCVNNKKIIGPCSRGPRHSSQGAHWGWVGHGPGITYN